MIEELTDKLPQRIFATTTMLLGFLLAGCEQLPQLHLPQSQPQVVIDTEPIADPVLSAPVRVSRSPEENEDPSMILARDGRFYVVWSSKQRGRVDLFISSSADGRTWSDERRVHDVPAEDYYPSLMQTRDG
ncbi:MAG: sialidase family protein, partial [Candidatus Binatia bacterium]